MILFNFTHLKNHTMKTTINYTRHTCPISQNQHFIDEYGNLICLKSYKGDWGDWDEKVPCTADSDTLKTESAAE